MLNTILKISNEIILQVQITMQKKEANGYLKRKIQKNNGREKINLLNKVIIR